MKNSAYRLDEDPAIQQFGLAEITDAKRRGLSDGTDGTAGQVNTELIEQLGDRSFQEAVSFLLRAQWEREAKPADSSEDSADKAEGDLNLPPTQEPVRSYTFRNHIKRPKPDPRAFQAKVKLALKLFILGELVVAAIVLRWVLTGGA